MEELRRTHWWLGTLIAVGGALAFRQGHRWLVGTSLAALQLTGLLAVVVGLFVTARGVSRRAAQRAREADNAPP